jgi:GT2 family glycosyltransferase
MSKVAVVTIVSGRHDHLRNQRKALVAGIRPPDEHIVVAMGDPDIADHLANESRCHVLEREVTRPWPLAACRNAGAQRAIDSGAEVLVFLDVDCIPSPALIPRYEWLAQQSAYRNGILCGEVCYLPSLVPFSRGEDGIALLVEPHPARPRLDPAAVARTTDYTLFWSLSFAVTAQTWERVGGFCEDYRGYGGEDTDFGQRARDASVDMYWVGGAGAFHQYHPVSDPPVEHLDDILVNARTFHARWGWWPMLDWLTSFEAAGLVRFDVARQTWVRSPVVATSPDERRIRSCRPS